MKVKIVKCSDDQWYTKRIGETYEVDEECNTNYYSLTNGTLILKADTVPVSEIRYEISDCETCVTDCPRDSEIGVSSARCQHYCEHFESIDKVNQTVQCSWPKPKRLDVRKDYKDDMIQVDYMDVYKETCIDIISTKNRSSDNISIRIGKNYDTTIDQANSILKVMGLDYELYEATDWSKVEEGTEVKVIANGDMVKLLNYIPDLKTLIVRCGDSVFTIDEDNVELV